MKTENPLASDQPLTIEQVFQQVDADNSGRIEFQELAEWWSAHQKQSRGSTDEQALMRCMDLFEQYDHPTELVCAGCSGGTAEVCPKHGTDYLEYKCRYCCSVACWFCFGTTHFCDPCHNRAGHNVPKPCPSVNEKELPPGTPCPLGCVHPENGQEFALGCGLLRQHCARNAIESNWSA